MRGLFRLALAGLLALPLSALPGAPLVAAAAAFDVQAGGGTADNAVQAFANFPGTITIDVGDSVTWSAGSGEPHNISFGTPPFDPVTSDQVFAPAGGSSYDGNGFAGSGVLVPGKPYTLSFTKVGTYSYQCLFHPASMRGTVVVQPAGTPYPTAPGAYQPASDPQLAAWIHAGTAELTARQVPTKRNADGTTTYLMDTGLGDGKSFGLLRFSADSLAIHTGDSVV